MNNSIRLDIVRNSITQILIEAESGLKKLRDFQSEGTSTDLESKAKDVLEAIRNTAMYDVNDEYHTLLQKSGAGPINDPDAKGPPEINARFITEWLFDDLEKVHQLIVLMLEIEPEKGADEAGLDRTLLIPLLEEVAGGMNQSYAALIDALRPLLDSKSIP